VTSFVLLLTDQPPAVVDGAAGNGGAIVTKTATREPAHVQLLLTLTALGFIGLFLVLPLAAVFAQALEKGWGAYVAALREPMALSALRLTLLTAAIAVPRTWCSASRRPGRSRSSSSPARTRSSR
jgi:ABC-type Fe3+ transport system permease subunit